MNVITSNVLKNIHNQGFYSFIRNRRLESDVTNLISTINFNPQEYLALFESNRGKTSDGRALIIPGQDVIMIPIKLEIFKDLEDRLNYIKGEENFLERLSDRSKKDKLTLAIIVNGKKVPDDEIYLALQTGCTDMFVPAKYFELNNPNNRVHVLRKKFMYFDYFSQFHDKHSTAQSIIIDTTDGGDIDVNDVTMNVYVDGSYLTDDQYTLTDDATNPNKKMLQIKPLRLREDSSRITSNVEIMIDSMRHNMYSEHILLDDGTIVLYVPRDSEEVAAETLVSKTMCEFIINERTINYNDIEQISNRHFLYTGNIEFTGEELVDLQTRIITHDADKTSTASCAYLDITIEEAAFKTDESIIRSILNKPDGSDFFSSYRSNITPQCPFETKAQLDDMMGYGLESVMLDMIVTNSNSLRLLLQQYGIRHKEYQINNALTKEHIGDPYIDILLDQDSYDNQNYQTRALMVYINDHKIPTSSVQQLSIRQQDILRVPRSYIKSDNDTLRVFTHPITNHGNFIYRSSCREFYQNVYTLTLFPEDIGYTKKSDDIRLFTRKVVEDPEVILPSSMPDTVRFVFMEVDHETYTVQKNSDESITIKFIDYPWDTSDETLDNPLLVVNANHYNIQETHIEDADDINRMVSILNPINEYGELLPVIYNDYEIKCFSNGQELLGNSDYFIVGPDTVFGMCATIAIMKRVINPADIIEIVSTGIVNHQVCAYETVAQTNKYALLYFDNLPFPFSLEYLSLSVNDQRVWDNDITILSDKLIRLDNVEIPMINVVVKTILGVDLTEFNPYIEMYNDNKNPFDELIRSRSLHSMYDIITPRPKPPADPLNIQNIYELAVSSIDSNNKTPNPKRSITITERVNPFGNKVAMDLDDNRIDRYINCNEPRNYKTLDDAVMMDSDQVPQTFIEINPNSTKVLFKNIIIDCNERIGQFYENMTKVVTMVKGGMFGNIIDCNDLEVRTKHRAAIGSYIHDDDPIYLNSNVKLDHDDDVYLDSNEIIS